MIVTVPNISDRLAMMGISTPTRAFIDEHASFAARLIHGPHDRIVQRRADEKAHREWAEASMAWMRPPLTIRGRGHYKAKE